MARAKQQADTGTEDRIRQQTLNALRDKAARMAAILAGTADPGERHRALLHANFGLTAAMQAEWGTFDDAELIADTIGHYSLWLGKDGALWQGESYLASAAEVRQIAGEELAAALRRIESNNKRKEPSSKTRCKPTHPST